MDELDQHDAERTLLGIYKEKLADAVRDQDEASGRVRKYEAAVAGIEAVLEGSESESVDAERVAPQNIGTSLNLTVGHRNGSPGRGQPKGRQAVQMILDETPGEPWRFDRLAAEMIKRGWAAHDSNDPAAAARAAFNRLRKHRPEAYSLTARGALAKAHVSHFALDEDERT